MTETTARRRRVRRGEGEVTEWPRGLTSYVPAGPDDARPSPDEDRVANRLALAGRLLGLLRAAGASVEPEVAALHEARSTLASGDRAQASRQIDGLLARLDERARERPPP